MHAKLVKCIGQRKYNMEVGYRQQFFISCLYPLFALLTLAFGAMPVTATIIAYAQQTTRRTAIYMTAE